MDSSSFPVRPSVAADFARLTLGSGRRRRFEVGSLDDVASRYRAGIDWLVRAQDEAASGGVVGGVSYGYSVRGGWRRAYPETTGYIAPTLWDAAVRLDRPELADRAVAAVEWLLTVQHDNGAIPNPTLGLDDGVVFDTGQVLFGFTRASAETGDERFVEAARRARRWLVAIAGDDGRWTRNTFNGIPHAYNARTAWAVVESCRADPDPEALEIALVNLRWALSLEHDGWFEEAAFEAGASAFTHTIAYTIRGLLESGRLLEDAAMIDVARRAADVVAAEVAPDGFLAGRFDAAGVPTDSFCCLTGNAQMAIIWYRLAADPADAFAVVADRAMAYVAQTQTFGDTHGQAASRRGAIRGSQPIWGAYSPFTYPNWATKFFVDALADRMDLHETSVRADNG